MFKMECEKCKSEMVKSGSMDSGNAKYDVMKCKNCGNEKLTCQGLN